MKKEKRQIPSQGRGLLIGYALYLCAVLRACILDIPINVYGSVTTKPGKMAELYENGGITAWKAIK